MWLVNIGGTWMKIHRTLLFLWQLPASLELFQNKNVLKKRKRKVVSEMIKVSQLLWYLMLKHTLSIVLSNQAPIYYTSGRAVSLHKYSLYSFGQYAHFLSWRRVFLELQENAAHLDMCPKLIWLGVRGKLFTTDPSSVASLEGAVGQS